MLTEEQCVELLQAHASSDEVYTKILSHVQAVKSVAVRIGSLCSGVDMDLLIAGSLLHDIGRFSTGIVGKEKIRHGVIGAEILLSEGVDDRLALICERHIGVGITKEDIIAQDLPLPHKDFLPESKEEKIIAYADNLIFGSVEKTFSDVEERFRRELGEEHVKRLYALREEIRSWMSEPEKL